LPAPRAGIDVGGTFTDAVLVDGRRRVRIAKVRTTPPDFAEGFVAALRALEDASGVPATALGYLVHGTTVAANAVVEGRTARVGLLTTAGFRDVLEIGTQQRASLYDLHRPRPDPLVPRDLRLEARERIGPQGEVVEPLSDDDVLAAAAAFERDGVEAVAVCFLFAFANPSHEQRAERLLASRLPGVPISTSSRAAPELREYPRTATTALNASLLPLAGRYVEQLDHRLAGAGAEAPLHLMQSNGGVATAPEAARLPVSLVASGPAAGVIGAARLGALAGERDLLSFDMGGTTADVALIAGGEPQLRYRGEAAGHPISLPQIDVLSVGAGGGSIAHVDDFGSLHVGPQSAGADPGPAAYGMGGDRATVTDAHVVLGTLRADRPLAGTMALDTAAARRAIERHVGTPLGLSAADAARAVIRIADATMVRALRVISVARGLDPRRFCLVAFGGAGPMHACGIADQLGVRRVLLPAFPGVSSALGLLLSDVRHDLRRSWVRPTATARIADLRASFTPLQREGRALLDGAGLAGRGRIDLALDMRYRGQAYELTVPLRAASRAGLARAERDFHAVHRRAYGHDRPVEETEIITLRVRATGPVRARSLDVPARPAARGPAVIPQADTTIVVPRGWRLRPAAAGSSILERTR
jgi:N-methylhydantoinase A